MAVAGPFVRSVGTHRVSWLLNSEVSAMSSLLSCLKIYGSFTHDRTWWPMPSKRFLLFAFDCYYPTGGWNDFIGSYDSLDEASTAAKHCNYDFKQIVDIETGEKY